MSFVPPLASMAAVRPVFMIIMGLSLMIFAWRLARTTHGWTSRWLVGGALLLGFGYALLLPMTLAGGHFHGDAANAAAWDVVKTVTMNLGWLALGIGLVLHAQVFQRVAARP